MDPEASRAEIEGLLAHFQCIVADTGMLAAAGDIAEWLTDTLAAAEARWAIDHGKAVVPDGLAALACVKPKTVANLMAAREIASDGDGRIPAAEAMRYLERRGDFIRSNWQHPPRQSEVPESPKPSTLVDQVFVLVEGDGNPSNAVTFCPCCLSSEIWFRMASKRMRWAESRRSAHRLAAGHGAMRGRTATGARAAGV